MNQSRLFAVSIYMDADHPTEKAQQHIADADEQPATLIEDYRGPLTAIPSAAQKPTSILPTMVVARMLASDDEDDYPLPPTRWQRRLGIVKYPLSRLLKVWLFVPLLVGLTFFGGYGPAISYVAQWGKAPAGTLDWWLNHPYPSLIEYGAGSFTWLEPIVLLVGLVIGLGMFFGSFKRGVDWPYVSGLSPLKAMACLILCIGMGWLLIDFLLSARPYW